MLFLKKEVVYYAKFEANKGNYSIEFMIVHNLLCKYTNNDKFLAFNEVERRKYLKI